jgi:solute carrier family 25 carnitine/acylcarnitine transporter 20/29
VFQQLMKEEGPRGLYRGWLPVMMRAFPANASKFGWTAQILTENKN